MFFFKLGLFIVTKHTVPLRSPPLSGMQSHHTHTNSLSVKLMSLHYNNSRLHNSKVTVCLLTARPLAELLHSSYFPDPKLPQFSPCENINKHCFYYCHSGKFQGTTRPPTPRFLPFSACRERAPRGHRAVLWSVRPELQDVEGQCLRAVARNRT